MLSDRNKPADIAFLKPRVRALAEDLIAKCAEHGFKVIVSRAYRSSEEQDSLYARGRTEPGPIVTMARAGYSFHNYGVAFDIRPILSEAEESKREEYYRLAGKLGMELGLEWGGTWKEFLDLPHFQYTAGYSIADFQAGLINENDFAERSMSESYS